MAYSQGGKIDAADYNSLVSTINTVWSSSGPGQIGYGQTALSTVGASGVVTATQWSTLINTLNNLRNHQSGTGSGISAVTAGAKINHLSALQTQATLVNTNAALYATQGATTTGSNFTTEISGSSGVNGTISIIVFFASADASRYFFRAGGQLNLVLSTSGSNGSGSSSSVARLITGLGGVGVRANDNTGRTGSGITLNTNNTDRGYFRISNGSFADNVLVAVTDSTASYTTSTAEIAANPAIAAPAGNTGASVSSTTNPDQNGANAYWFRITYTVANKAFDDTLGITLNSRIDVVYPETTYLTSSWGTPLFRFQQLS